MAVEITMPQLGESVTEGTIVKWLVSGGDRVKKYDPLCEIMTDKVNAEVPTFVDGTIADIVAEEGQTLKVGELLCTVESKEDDTSDAADEKAPETPRAESEHRAVKRRYSPAVRKLAQKYQLDLESFKGTGKGGRVTRKDIEAYVAQNKGRPETTQARPASVEPAVRANAAAEDERIPVSPVRGQIAERMAYSKKEIPHAWMMVEADASDLVSLRDRVKDDFKRKEGFSLTFLPFFVKAVVESLKDYPMLNSVWAEEEIIYKKGIHISIAVSTENALYVPVIRDADQKSIYGIARSIYELAHKARTGTLSVEDTRGGTFTVNNTGVFGSVQSMPIINPPQAAIMSVESIVKRPVVIDDMIAVRSMVNMCMSLDHRILDGWSAGNFLQAVKQRVEGYRNDTAIY